MALLVPGHTPAEIADCVGGTVFVGDTLLTPDVGNAQSDFPSATRAPSTVRCAASLALPP